VAALIDTNILVYRIDARDPEKRRRAMELLRDGAASGSIRLAHQAVVEFVWASTRRQRDGSQLLDDPEARRLAENMLSQFPVLYPNEAIVRTAVRGAATYGLSWYDAHMWAYAEHHGLPELWSEDFEHDRVYGTVRVVNPFLSG
jgi:predicted nucleic acid-binding protein